MSSLTPREIIESLRSEITELRQEWTEERINTAALQAHAERVGQANDLLVVENAALRKDKARLDWMEQQNRIDYCTGYWLKKESTRTLRAAIDAARKEAQP